MNPPTTAVLLGEVRAEMARRRVTAAKVALATDISRTSLSRKLNGHNEFTVAELFRVTEFLGLSLSDLLRRAESVAA